MNFVTHITEFPKMNLNVCKCPICMPILKTSQNVLNVVFRYKH